MTVSRRAFFGLAAGAAAAAAGVAQASPTLTGIDLAADPDRTVMWIPQWETVSRREHYERLSYYYSVDGMRFGGLSMPLDNCRCEMFAVAADLPPFPPIRSIDVHMTRERAPKPRPVSQKEFERGLLSPIGKGRLE